MDHRAPDMAERWASGETLESIGQSYGITRERVRQIMKKTGIASADDARAARRAEREAVDDRERAALRRWLDDHPGQRKVDAATALDIPVERIGRLLGVEAQLRFVDARDEVAATYSDDDVLEGLREAAGVLGDPLSADRYDVYSPQRGLATSVRIIQRFGTWNAACTAAGLTVNSGRPTYFRRWTEEEMLAHVADYLESPEARGTHAGYDTYARRTAGAPSSQTVRNTFGGWRGAKAGAQQVVAARLRRRRIAG